MKKEETARNEKPKKSSKNIQHAPSADGAVFTNAALLSYIEDYLRGPDEKTYEIIENENSHLQGADEEVLEVDPKQFFLHKQQSLSTLLISTMLDKEDPPGCAEEREETPHQGSQEEEKKKKPIEKIEELEDINEELAEVLEKKLITKEDVENLTDTVRDKIEKYKKLLKKVSEVNRKNKKTLIQKRKPHFAHFFYLSLLENIDGGIEGIYAKRNKIKKKKKEEEAGGYFSELEDLLDRRERVQRMCKGVPENLMEMENDEIGVEDVFDVMSEEEAKTLKKLLPPFYHTDWL